MALTNRDDKFKSLTLDDVACAIEILEYYTRQAQKAKMAIQNYQRATGYGAPRPYGGGMGSAMGLSFDDFVNISLEVDKRKHGGPANAQQEAVDKEPSAEDIARMKAAVDKVRNKPESLPP